MKMSLTHSNDERAPWPVSWPHLCPRGTKEQHACCPVGVTHVTDHHQWHKSFLNYKSQKLAGCPPSPKIPSWAHGSLQLPTCFAVWLGLPEWVWPTKDGAMRLPSGPGAEPRNGPHSTSPGHCIKREGLWESLDDRNLYPLASLRRRHPPGKPGNPIRPTWARNKPVLSHGEVGVNLFKQLTYPDRILFYQAHFHPLCWK